MIVQVINFNNEWLLSVEMVFLPIEYILSKHHTVGTIKPTHQCRIQMPL